MFSASFAFNLDNDWICVLVNINVFFHSVVSRTSAFCISAAGNASVLYTSITSPDATLVLLLLYDPNGTSTNVRTRLTKRIN